MNPSAPNPAAPSLVELEVALEREPGNAELAKALGNAHKAAGNRERAAICYRQALRVSPDHEASLYNLGMVLHEMEQLEEAARTFDRLRQLAPRDADALAHLGAIQCKQSRFADAIETLRQALALAPCDAGLRVWLARAYDGVGGGLLAQGRPAEAASYYVEALQVLPDAASLHNGRGCALLLLAQVDAAVEQLQRAVELDPELAGAQHNLANAYGLRGDRDLAIRAYTAALALRPGDAAVREGLLFEMQNICDWSRFEELSALQRASAVDPAQNIGPFSLLSIASTPGEQLQCARIYGRRQSALVAEARERLSFRFDRAPRSRLRIGYLSADYHDHVTPYVMAEMFELHDRSRVETIAYSYGPDDGSAMRARLLRAFDRFVELGGLSDAQAAAAIHADGVDILVDLKGYTQHARTGITALRPAPVQVSYMGYPGTLAAPFIDYFVVDRFVVPPRQAMHYGEKLVFLPDTYYVNDRRRPLAAMPRRAELGLPEQGFVFCCFNQAYKILPDVFARWMRLLTAVPGSVLWLLGTNRWAEENLRKEARARGVDPARLLFAPRVAPDRHLARVAAADLFLDTRPYNAHTTATDALWVGVPVLTWPGETFASRVAGSLLAALGMPELIVDSAEAYEALALDLARDRTRLQALRAKLASVRGSAALFDTAAFTRNMETAYERMWQRYATGGEPETIELRAG